MLIYISLLIGASFSIIYSFELEVQSLHPVSAQLLGFVTLTLPVFFYFYWSESSKQRGTFGKRKMGIELHAKSKNAILLRNVFKFLPWEIAHTGVHWVVYYSLQEMETPIWVWLFLIVPQLVAAVYFVSLLRSKGQVSLYDNWAETKVQFKA